MEKVAEVRAPPSTDFSSLLYDDHMSSGKQFRSISITFIIMIVLGLGLAATVYLGQ